MQTWQSDDRPSHELQWHPVTSGGSAVLQLRTTENEWMVVYGNSLDSPPFTYNTLSSPHTNVITNTWNHWVIKVVWANNNTGRIRVWKDGDLVVSYNGETDDGSGQYIKVGINNWSWHDGNIGTVKHRVFYYDNFRIGNASATYNDVAPIQQFPEPTGN
jgi:hypothetical protein